MLSTSTVLLVIVLLSIVFIFYNQFIVTDFDNESFTARLNILKEYLRTSTDNIVPRTVGYVSHVDNQLYVVTHFDTNTLKDVKLELKNESSEMFNFSTQQFEFTNTNSDTQASINAVLGEPKKFIAHVDDGLVTMECSDGHFDGTQCVSDPVCDRANVNLPLTEDKLNKLMFNKFLAQNKPAINDTSIVHPTAYIRCDNELTPHIEECLNGETFQNTSCVYNPTITTNGQGLVTNANIHRINSNTQHTLNKYIKRTVKHYKGLNKPVDLHNQTYENQENEYEFTDEAEYKPQKIFFSPDPNILGFGNKLGFDDVNKNVNKNVNKIINANSKTNVYTNNVINKNANIDVNVLFDNNTPKKDDNYYISKKKSVTNNNICNDVIDNKSIDKTTAKHKYLIYNTHDLQSHDNLPIEHLNILDNYNKFSLKKPPHLMVPVNHRYPFDASPCVQHGPGHTFASNALANTQFFECLDGDNMFLHTCTNVVYENNKYKCEQEQDCLQFENGTGVTINTIHNNSITFATGKSVCDNGVITKIVECDTGDFVFDKKFNHPLEFTFEVALPTQIFDSEIDQCVDFNVDKITINNDNFVVKFLDYPQLSTSMVGRISKVNNKNKLFTSNQVSDFVTYSRDMDEICLDSKNCNVIECANISTGIVADLLDNTRYNVCKNGVLIEEVQLHQNEYVSNGEVKQLDGYTGECRFKANENYFDIPHRNINGYSCFYTVPTKADI
ncbi:vp91 [Matsumuraeses phaseoli granulovirus]|uniref:Vp91 n=1 Tax=Matsumuraeses phaseoli granulovirus TaxID=2760664 RepID=A0AAE7MLI0_9BBAC|nr:vp91 [Matsumuraeses phaseoli granulovirus]QOD40054.1 vp91 [Matsumuraeses phaseoli granulovirus]